MHMPPVSTQTIPPIMRSRHTAPIVALIAVVCILSAVFIYLRTGEHLKTGEKKILPINNALSAEAKAQYAQETQVIVASQPAVSPSQKAAIVSQMQAVEKNQVPLSQDQK